MTNTNITEEMIDKCAHAYAAADGFDWVDVSQLWQERYRRHAAAGLGAALAGYTVTQLPAPDGTDDGGTWWRHDHGSVIADSLSTAESAQIMQRRAGPLLAAADHIQRRLASESSGGETP